MHPHGSGLTPALVLVVTAAAWGSALTLLKSVDERMPLADFMAVRYCVAALALTLVAHRSMRRLPAVSVRRSLLLGLVWGVAQLIQISALRYTTASVSGFIAGMFVVATPVLAWLLLGHRLPASTWAAVAVATVGFATLSFNGLSIGRGELFTGISAILYAVQIVGLSVWSRRQEVVAMSALQMIVVAGVYLLAAAPHGIATPVTARDWALLAYLALGVAAGGLVAQSWAQTRLAPTRSALVLTLEPAFTASTAVLLRGETMTWRLVVGGGLILGAIVLSELAAPQTLAAARRAPRSP